MAAERAKYDDYLLDRLDNMLSRRPAPTSMASRKMAVYLFKLPGLQKKVRVAVDWALDLVFSKDIVELPTLRSATMSEPEGPLTGGARGHESGVLEHSESRQ
jgi:hypothetical protein